ncbi:MAG: adenylate/guanylate cyclase domain-containing protein, partial [Acidobacteriaceae bacterium]|nr:adenylate/guanylate cyclase domain-containing protein [Acidobacteriaceae bacterium]
IARDHYARLIEKLHEGGARVVAFDVTFPSPEKNSGLEALRGLEQVVGSGAGRKVVENIHAAEKASDNDAVLAKAIGEAGNVILGHIFLSPERAAETDSKAAETYYNTLWGQPFPQMLKVKSKQGDFDMTEAWISAGGQVAWGIEPNIPVLAEAAKSYGFINSNPDADGTFRRGTLIIRYQDQDYFPSLAFQAVKLYEGIPDQSIVGYLAREGLERIDLGPHRLVAGKDGTLLVNYAGPYHSYTHYSMIDVIEGKVPSSTFKDGLVLVGPTALGMGDLRTTPFETDVAYMGVEIHANLVDNILHSGERGRSYLIRGAEQQTIDLVVIIVLGMGMAYGFSHMRPLLSMQAALLALCAFAGFADMAFRRWGMWISFVIPAATLVIEYAAITSYRMIFEEREKRKIRKSFSQYVSPGVIRLIEQNPDKYFKPGGELKQLTVMFSDIRGFTSISEGLSPNDLVLLLNEYLGEMTDLVFQFWGTLDKYIGDAVMAFWGSPIPRDDHALQACLCALRMHSRLRELNRNWVAQGKEQLSIGIGINTGMMNVGNMGSTKRLAWTVMGDNVNLASRLEGLNKKYGTGIVISEFTSVQVEGRFVCRELDCIRVKGKHQPVKIFELLDVAENSASYEDLLSQFTGALVAYRAQKWGEAIERFEALLSRYPDDGPSHEYLRRSHEFVTHPPDAGWDGVYVMETK